MRGEARRLKDLKSRFNDVSYIRVPGVIDSHTTSKVLTMEFLEGENLLNFVESPVIAQRYLSLMMRMMFRVGACQADPHFANLPYNKELGVFNFLDAGQEYFVPQQERTNFAKLLVAMYAKDDQAIVNAMISQKSRTFQPHAVSTFKEQLKPMLEALDLQDPKTVFPFLANTHLAAKSLGLDINFINPLLWKTLFTAVSVAKTLDPKIGFGWIVTPRILFPLLETDPSFVLQTGFKNLRSRFFGPPDKNN